MRNFELPIDLFFFKLGQPLVAIGRLAEEGMCYPPTSVHVASNDIALTLKHVVGRNVKPIEF